MEQSLSQSQSNNGPYFSIGIMSKIPMSCKRSMPRHKSAANTTRYPGVVIGCKSGASPDDKNMSSFIEICRRRTNNCKSIISSWMDLSQNSTTPNKWLASSWFTLGLPKKKHTHMLTYLGLRLIGLQEATSLGHFGNSDVGQNKSPGGGSDVEITDAEQKNSQQAHSYVVAFSLSLSFSALRLLQPR